MRFSLVNTEPLKKEAYNILNKLYFKLLLGGAFYGK